ncbi:MULTISPECIES: phosphatidylglycerophosphatase A family protein [Psychrobacter]|jgi:phosphatidylglycerophosphatase A|uniref:phosphatidylglycerophosphatase A family protein n=1 Tax=Psychrobacter TaxID=497 RepID=UPI000869C2EB|nr:MULTISPECIES: phosphatidylglycerophosphatase A [Psychrobacter]MBA6245473.1 phosphatidylglycerophosphatase A [Psychrobacter sp. Urea-trap-18]MBA6284768.1 phosphatidylglycerophosphatase A [Psychrobacter sp. Urea-trap-16]MBA6318613.1 phosphatidylglycerophosphatase A [Psychrobacter sp. Urea-trap-20]MBA6333073.1 phosphatidylglycerophosphatase A [Psychrobacter sp. Urea-trap-19]OEH67681.1 MAG: phosphatidylglycerophosphatase A [Psychrobacter sp. B29-1]
MTDHDLSKPDIRKANDCPPLPVGASVLDRVVYWLGLGLGSGLPRRAPGTWGTVGGLIIAIPLLSLGFVPFLILTILSCILGVWICGRTAELMQGHDDPHIVWDEWAGIWITLLPLSYMGIADDNFWQNVSQELSIFAIVFAFILFRFFDIVKPPPIGWADKRVAGGLGIMLDDIIAGIMAAVVWVAVMFGVLL